MGTEKDLLADLVRAGEEIQRLREEVQELRGCQKAEAKIAYKERNEAYRRLELAEEWLERELSEEEWTDYCEMAEELE